MIYSYCPIYQVLTTACDVTTKALLEEYFVAYMLVMYSLDSSSMTLDIEIKTPTKYQHRKSFCFSVTL